MGKHFSIGLCIVAFLAGFWEGGYAQSPQVRVDKMVVCTGISDGRPDGEAKKFDPAVQRVYCWAKITTDTVPVQLKFIWYYNGRKISEAPFEVKISPRITWRYKTVWPGPWRVDIANDSGNLLASSDFVVLTSPSR